MTTYTQPKHTLPLYECVLCKDEYMGYGNNAAPVAEGKCCDNCNFTQVISARLVKQYFKVADGGNPDVDYFETLDEAKAFCDKYDSLDYGLIMLCDFEKKEIGDWGDFEEEEEEDECCQSCGTTCLDHTSNKGRGSEAACPDCKEIRCKYCPCECKEEEEGSECMGCAKTYTVDTDIGDQFCNDCGDDWFCLECLDYGDGWDLEYTEFLCFRCDDNRQNEEVEDEEEEVQEG